MTADPIRALVAFDYDGTLAPIVADPNRAVPHPAVIEQLELLAPFVGRVAVVTGRPALVAVGLARLDDADIAGLVLLGHYGLERWDAATGEVQTVAAPAGLGAARAALPGLLAELGRSDAAIEDKGLSVAVHVRGQPDAGAALVALRQPLTELALRCGLVAEPGKMVIELRSPGMDKGQALRRLVEEDDAQSVVFVGDDLGDLAAFDEVDRLRERGVAGLLVCSGSDEERTLADRADLVVDGPAGVAGFVEALVDRLRAGRD